MLAPPQLKKLEQESKHRASFTGRGLRSCLTTFAQVSYSFHTGFSAFSQFSNRHWATGFHLPQVFHRFLIEPARSFHRFPSEKEFDDCQ